jgi:5,10-methenyltetrahydromethanopterin hydrogenase
MSLSDVLKKDEKVTIQVGTGKDAEGKFTYTNAEADFDGTDLTVTDCELVDSLVGMKSSKPGEILYKFIDELKNAGHITKTFTIAPWKLCSVERDGVRQTLEQLRSTVG